MYNVCKQLFFSANLPKYVNKSISFMQIIDERHDLDAKISFF